MSQGEVKVVRVTSESGVLTGEIKMKKKKKSDINCPSSVKMSIVGVKNQVSPKQNKRKTGTTSFPATILEIPPIFCCKYYEDLFLHRKQWQKKWLSFCCWLAAEI